VGVTGEELRGQRYPVRVAFDERGWTGWVRMQTGQELSIRAVDLARLGVALTHLVAAIDGGDPATMTIEPTWDVSVPGRRVGLAVVPLDGAPRARHVRPLPRPARAETFDARAAHRILAAVAAASTDG
jgi:hypothetical protein